MTRAEQIFEKHIGLNTELGYSPYKKEDIINAINEALNDNDEVWEGAEKYEQKLKEKINELQTLIDKL